MPTFKYAKLVRDNIADFHVKSGHSPTVRYLKGKELIKALCAKLHEESDEVDGALNRDELIEEIADVYQILEDLCSIESIDRLEVESIRIQKASRKGGFKRGVYIEKVEIPNDDDKWARYCRRQPEKYPEIS